MVTTYHLRENAKWHDGAPLTARDFVFAFDVYSSPDVPIYRRNPEIYMSTVEAQDDTPWSSTGPALLPGQRPPLHAAGSAAQPPARGRLSPGCRCFRERSHWTNTYVGSGPFRVDRWEPGVSITAKAFTDWVLGPPRAAALEIRFVADATRSWRSSWLPIWTSAPILAATPARGRGAVAVVGRRRHSHRKRVADGAYGHPPERGA